MTDPRAALAADAAAADVGAARPPQSPARLFWRQFRKSPLGIAGGALLVVFYAAALFGPFLAPYAQETMDRERFFHPPQRLRLWDAAGRSSFVSSLRERRREFPGRPGPAGTTW